MTCFGYVNYKSFRNNCIFFIKLMFLHKFVLLIMSRIIHFLKRYYYFSCERKSQLNYMHDRKTSTLKHSSLYNRQLKFPRKRNTLTEKSTKTCMYDITISTLESCPPFQNVIKISGFCVKLRLSEL